MQSSRLTGEERTLVWLCSAASALAGGPRVHSRGRWEVGLEDLRSLIRCQHFYSAITALAVTVTHLKLTRGSLGA